MVLGLLRRASSVLSKAFSAISRRKAISRLGRGQRPRPSFRPSLEALEERLTPATFDWFGPVQGVNDFNWSTLANWRVNGVTPVNPPGANDVVMFTADHNVQSYVDGLFAGGQVDTLVIDSGYTSQITLQHPLTVKFTFQLDGIISGSYNYIVPTAGEYNWEGGTLRGFGGPTSYQTIIQPGATMTIGDNVAHNLDGRSVQVFGTLNWADGSFNITNAGGLIVGNAATFTITAAGAHDIDGDATGSFTLAGKATVANNATLTIRIPVQINQTALVTLSGVGSLVQLRAATNLSGGQFAGIGSIENYSAITVTGGNSLVNGGATLAQENGSSINSANGSLQFSNGSALNVDGATTFSGASPIMIASTGILKISANLTLTGILGNMGVATWDGGTITINAPGAFNNAGTLLIDSAMNLTLGGTGAFTNTAPGFITKDQLNTVTINNAANNLNFTNNGRISLNAGALILLNSWTQGFGSRLNFLGGNFQVGGTFTNNGRVMVDTTGTIFANSFVNNNVIDMRNTPNELVNTLSIAAVPGGGAGGNFTQGGAGQLYLNIYGDTDADRLAVAGTATLGGELFVGLGSGYQPAGQAKTWTLLAYAQRNNQFAHIAWPAGNWQSNYGQTSLTATWAPN